MTKVRVRAVVRDIQKASILTYGKQEYETSPQLTMVLFLDHTCCFTYFYLIHSLIQLETKSLYATQIKR